MFVCWLWLWKKRICSWGEFFFQSRPNYQKGLERRKAVKNHKNSLPWTKLQKIYGRYTFLVTRVKKADRELLFWTIFSKMIGSLNHTSYKNCDKSDNLSWCKVPSNTMRFFVKSLSKVFRNNDAKCKCFRKVQYFVICNYNRVSAQ